MGKRLALIAAAVLLATSLSASAQQQPVIYFGRGPLTSAVSPTFSGTVTFPDGCTWASTGVTCAQANTTFNWSPTGTGTVTLNPATAGTLNNIAIGGSTPLAGAFTTLTANNTVTFSPASHNVAVSPTGTGTVTLGPPAGQLIFANVATGTNADVLCLSAGGVVLLQAATSCTISSRRFKYDFGPVHDSGLAEVMKMRPILFKYKDGASNPDPNGAALQLGFYAEDMAKVDARLALYEQDMQTVKSYRQDGVMALAVKAIQELKADNDNLRRRVAVLERRTR